jgi:septum formation topological specificity factor MinE
MPRKYLETIRDINALSDRLKTSRQNLKSSLRTITHLRSQIIKIQSKYIHLSGHSLNITRENSLLCKRIIDLKTTSKNIPADNTIVDLTNPKPLKHHNKKNQTSPTIHHKTTETLLITTRNRKIQITPDLINQYTSTIEIPLTPNTMESD